MSQARLGLVLSHNKFCSLRNQESRLSPTANTSDKVSTIYFQSACFGVRFGSADWLVPHCITLGPHLESPGGAAPDSRHAHLHLNYNAVRRSTELTRLRMYFSFQSVVCWLRK